jgi:hypothetical protein
MFRNLTNKDVAKLALLVVTIFSRRVAAPSCALRDVSVTVSVNQCVYIETRTVGGSCVTAVSAVPYCISTITGRTDTRHFINVQHVSTSGCIVQMMLETFALLPCCAAWIRS